MALTPWNHNMTLASISFGWYLPAAQLVGLERNAVTYVDSISSALALVKGSDLVTTVPERHTRNLRRGMFSFSLPITSPVIMVSMLWHPRMDADPAHRWLRQCVLDVCGDDHQGGITLPHWWAPKLEVWYRRSPVAPVFRLLRVKQEVLIHTGFRRQWCSGWCGESNATANKLLEGTTFHHSAGQAKFKVIAWCQPENAILPY